MQGNEQSAPSPPQGFQPRSRKTGTRRLASAAWEPLTPGGVARYSTASLNRVCGLQIVTALLSMVVILWFLHTALFPVIREAITQLPEAGRMAFGELESPEPAILPLAENSHLSIHLDLDNTHRPPTSHDLDVKLTRKGLYACTSFGCSFLPYGPSWRFPVDRTETLAWWDAWSAMLLAMAGFGTVVGLMVVWWALATVYCVVPRLLAFLGERRLTMGGAWRLSAAALIPGAVTMLAGLVAYGLGMFDWVHFLLISGVHLVVPWLYLVAAPFQLAREERVEKPASAEAAPASESPFRAGPVAGGNPFHGASAPGLEESETGLTARSAGVLGGVERGAEERMEAGARVESEEVTQVGSEVDSGSMLLPRVKVRGNPFAAAEPGEGKSEEEGGVLKRKVRKVNPFQGG